MRGRKTSPQLIEQCINLRRSGGSILGICQETGLSKSTVFFYIKDIILPQTILKKFRQNSRKATILSNRERVGRSRRLNRISTCPLLSPELVRLVAHFIFDGSLIRHQAVYYNRCLKIVVEQDKWVKKEFALKGRISLSGEVYRLVINSVEFVNLITYYKSVIIDRLEDLSLEYKIAFLQSFFDDEGSVYMSTTGKTRRVRGYQNNIEILELILNLLKDINIVASISKSGTYLEIRQRASLQLFQTIVSFSPHLMMNEKRRNSIYKMNIRKVDILQTIIDSYR